MCKDVGGAFPVLYLVSGETHMICCYSGITQQTVFKGLSLQAQKRP